MSLSRIELTTLLLFDNTRLISKSPIFGILRWMVLVCGPEPIYDIQESFSVQNGERILMV